MTFCGHSLKENIFCAGTDAVSPEGDLEEDRAGGTLETSETAQENYAGKIFLILLFYGLMKISDFTYEDFKGIKAQQSLQAAGEFLLRKFQVKFFFC